LRRSREACESRVLVRPSERKPQTSLQELLFREDAARLSGELHEQVVLLRREHDADPVHRHTPRGAIDLEQADLDQLPRRR
jgi:hypothetical protein